MNTPDSDMVLAEGDEVVAPPHARPTWAARLAFAGMMFVAVGAALVLGVLLGEPLQNLDVLCAGVTLAVAGMVLRAIASPVERPQE